MDDGDRRTEISPRLERHVRETFDESVCDEALDRLKAIVDPLGHDVSERVLAAVVLASNGDFDKFLEMAHLAEVDWRDVLVAAGLEYEDWETELTRRLGVD